MVVESQSSLGSTSRVDEWWRLEDPLLMPISEQFLIPQWGAHLQAARSCEKVEKTDKNKE